MNQKTTAERPPAAHTEGPWQVAGNGLFGLDIVACNADGILERVATVHEDSHSRSRTARTIANARLVAQSPRMLSSLRQIRDHLEDLRNQLAPELSELVGIFLAIERLDETIAAAEGRS